MGSQYKILLVCISLAVALFSLDVLSHNGGTDANGCHTDHSNNDYHCHSARSKESWDNQMDGLREPSSSLSGFITAIILVILFGAWVKHENNQTNKRKNRTGALKDGDSSIKKSKQVANKDSDIDDSTSSKELDMTIQRRKKSRDKMGIKQLSMSSLRSPSTSIARNFQLCHNLLVKDREGEWGKVLGIEADNDFNLLYYIIHFEIDGTGKYAKESFGNDFTECTVNKDAFYIYERSRAQIMSEFLEQEFCRELEQSHDLGASHCEHCMEPTEECRCTALRCGLES